MPRAVRAPLRQCPKPWMELRTPGLQEVSLPMEGLGLGGCEIPSHPNSSGAMSPVPIPYHSYPLFYSIPTLMPCHPIPPTFLTTISSSIPFHFHLPSHSLPLHSPRTPSSLAMVL